MTLRLCVAYDGTDFSGFQTQRSGRTVQGVLESALEELTGDPVRVRAAGRTDAGVHALGQVVSLSDANGLNPDLLMRSMAGLLPKDIAVTDAASGPDGFDARRSARSRTYVYLLWCADAPHPLYRKYAVWPRANVDACALSKSLQAVVGTHDFSSFARVREDQTPIRTILEANAVADGPFVRIRIVGESFLHQMVRSIVGTALESATSRKPRASLKDALEARDRTAAGAVAPAHGLTLVDVSYDDISWPHRPAVTWPWSDHVDVESQRSCA
jgi:tRNA pseudouridine38-40 synthase